MYKRQARDRFWNALRFWAVSDTIFWDTADDDTPKARAASMTVSVYFCAASPRRIFSNSSSEKSPVACNRA